MRNVRRLKIKTKNKSYSIVDSPFYKLRSKKKLAGLLGVELTVLLKLRNDEGNYSIFEQLSKKGKARKIQKPVNTLEVIHTRIASLLSRIAPPDYLHSGRKGFSNITNADSHSNDTKLMTSDIKAFFPSTTRVMIFSFYFSIMKMSPDVADILSHICTCHGHLPTGSRISMPLAFFANYRMFNELSNLCTKFNIKMTVYVDDLTFSGDNINRLFCAVVRKIIHKHGHVMHPSKTKMYKEDVPKLITGIVLTNNGLKVRNEQHRLLARDIDLWSSIKDMPGASETSVVKTLFGRLYSMGVIDTRYRCKVMTLRENTAK